MWNTVVPTWNTRKGYREAIWVYLPRALSVPLRYISAMADNAREQSPWSDAVAAQIRAERAAAQMTQAELIKASGLARSTYLRLEKGERVADVTQLARICGALGISLSEFLMRVEQRDPERESNGLG